MKIHLSKFRQVSSTYFKLYLIRDNLIVFLNWLIGKKRVISLIGSLQRSSWFLCCIIGIGLDDGKWKIGESLFGRLRSRCKLMLHNWLLRGVAEQQLRCRGCNLIGMLHSLVALLFRTWRIMRYICRVSFLNIFFFFSTYDNSILPRFSVFLIFVHSILSSSMFGSFIFTRHAPWR